MYKCHDIWPINQGLSSHPIDHHMKPLIIHLLPRLPKKTQKRNEPNHPITYSMVSLSHGKPIITLNHEAY
jgi:hypothetical protein